METSDTASPQHDHGEQTPSKFTPGPWFAEARTDGIIDIGPERSEVACIFGEHIDHLGAKDWANAHLIAAAPDMLEAMKAARDQTLMVQHSQETRLNDIYDILEAAIAKATGVTAS